MDDAPLDLVVVEQPFEVGKEHNAVVAAHDIEIAVVGTILRGSKVADEGDSRLCQSRQAQTKGEEDG